MKRTYTREFTSFYQSQAFLESISYFDNPPTFERALAVWRSKQPLHTLSPQLDQPQQEESIRWVNTTDILCEVARFSH